ncbi:MAG: histidinol dehydrogenase [Eubacteriales bacterium]|nr:histidinol dehydrogenase [Eubacteriales bacterium]
MKTLKIEKETTKNILSDLLKRSPNQYDSYAGQVQEILDAVKTRGDGALFELTKKFDGCDITADTVMVTKEEIAAAYEKVDDSLVDVIRKALANIREYHVKQKQYSWFDSKPDGTILGQKVTALSSVGVYVPGGKAAYPSSVLMNIVPAQVAGVKKIVMVTPPDKKGEVTPATLVAANEAGATHIYKVGGAQAIGALAFGTESIAKVDKIVGPGNIYVALAKKAVYGHVSIDSIAGPSEILVLADKTANPRFVAADLLSQAEHDELASAILVTTSAGLAVQVEKEIEGFLQTLSRSDIIRKSLDNFGYILVADTMEEAIEVANNIASEHLEIVTENPFEIMTKIQNAGAIFLGSYSSEPLGDYFAGPNHVLPTNGTAKFFSPLGVDDFIKKSSIIYYSKEALQPIHRDIESFAGAERLTAHANSIAVRFEEEDHE